MFYWVVRGLIKKVTTEQRLEGSEGKEPRGDPGKAFQA